VEVRLHSRRDKYLDTSAISMLLKLIASVSALVIRYGSLSLPPSRRDKKGKQQTATSHALQQIQITLAV
jgi:hypothetical protein